MQLCLDGISGFKAAVIVLAILLALTLAVTFLLGVYIFKLRQLNKNPPRTGMSEVATYEKSPGTVLSEVSGTYEKPQRSMLSEVADTYEKLR